MTFDQSADGFTPAEVDLSKLADAAAANPDVNLDAVACIAAGDCEILGSYADHLLDSQGLLVSETSGNWGPATSVALPNDASSTDPAVSGSSLACAAAGNCAGVLFYEDNGEHPSAELISESAGQWSTSELSTPVPETDIPPY